MASKSDSPRKKTASAKSSKKAKPTKKTSSQAPTARKRASGQEPVQEKEVSKIRIKIRAYDYRLIDESAKKIVNAVLAQGANIRGPVPLPTEIHKWTVNRSTFVHKDARDQYEMRIHKRLIDILNPTSKIIDSLMSLDLPAGVDIEIKY